jgi:hypothetical protein
LSLVIGLPGQIVDALDDGESLGCQHQDMSAAIIGVRHAGDESRRLQPIEQASERTRPDVETLRESHLIEPYELREMDEDSASRARHAWELGSQFSIEETAPQPGGLLQQPHDCIGFIRIGIILRQQYRPCDHDLLQQMADGRFVHVVATHELSHDRLGQKLIKCRLVERGPSRRRARGRTVG